MAVANADHPFQDLQSFVPESTRATIFAQGKMDVGDTMEAYAEALFNRRETIFQWIIDSFGPTYTMKTSIRLRVDLLAQEIL